MTNPKAHGPKVKRSEVLPAPALAVGVANELSSVSPRRLLAMKVSVQAPLSLPRAAGSLLPSRGGPQNPTGGAPGISPSRGSSPPAAPRPPECCFRRAAPGDGARRVLQREPSPTCRGAAKIAAAGTPGHSRCSRRAEQPRNAGQPCSEGSLAVGASAPDTWGHLSPCLAYGKISPRFTCTRCTSSALRQRAARQAGEQLSRQRPPAPTESDRTSRRLRTMLGAPTSSQAARGNQLHSPVLGLWGWGFSRWWSRLES